MIEHANNTRIISADDALKILSPRMDEIRRLFAVRELSLFGSVARNQARPDSDVDFLVTFAGRPTFDNYMGLKLYLEDLFGVSVDLAIRSDLRESLRSRVEREAVDVS